MDESKTRPSKWNQFSLRAMLLAVLVIAVFLGGRWISRRELKTEVSKLRQEIKDLDSKSATTSSRTRSTRAPARRETVARSSPFKTVEAVQYGGIREATTRADGSARYLDLDSGKLQWSHAIPGKTGFFYFQYGGQDRGNSPKWQFASAPTRDLLQYAGKPLEIHFRGARNSIRVAVGETWFARTLDDPNTIYVLYIKSQTKQEEMIVEYVILQAKESLKRGANQ